MKNLVLSLVPLFAIHSGVVLGHYGQSPDAYQQSSGGYNQTPYNQSNDHFNQVNPNNQTQTYYNRSQANGNNNQQYDYYNPGNSSNANQSYYNKSSSNTNQPNGSVSKEQTYSEKKYPQDSYSSEVDRQLNGKIREKITGWFTDNYKDIALNSNNGVVTVSGFVKSNDDINKLVNEIRKIDGVRSVNSNVQIKQQ